MHQTSDIMSAYYPHKNFDPDIVHRNLIVGRYQQSSSFRPIDQPSTSGEVSTVQSPQTVQEMPRSRSSFSPLPAPVVSSVFPRSASEAGLDTNASKFRQLPCRTFVSVGTCPYRERCVYLHDPRCISKEAKTKTRKKNREDSIVDSIFWPVMPFPAVCGKLDMSGQPHVIQPYAVPMPQQDRYRLHDQSLYSLWNHFVEFCSANASSATGHHGVGGTRADFLDHALKHLDSVVNYYTQESRMSVFVALAQCNRQELTLEELRNLFESVERMLCPRAARSKPCAGVEAGAAVGVGEIGNAAGRINSNSNSVGPHYGFGQHQRSNSPQMQTSPPPLPQMARQQVGHLHSNTDDFVSHCDGGYSSYSPAEQDNILRAVSRSPTSFPVAFAGSVSVGGFNSPPRQQQTRESSWLSPVSSAHSIKVTQSGNPLDRDFLSARHDHLQQYQHQYQQEEEKKAQQQQQQGQQFCDFRAISSPPLPVCENNSLLAHSYPHQIPALSAPSVGTFPRDGYVIPPPPSQFEQAQQQHAGESAAARSTFFTPPRQMLGAHDSMDASLERWDSRSPHSMFTPSSSRMREDSSIPRASSIEYAEDFSGPHIQQQSSHPTINVFVPEQQMRNHHYWDRNFSNGVSPQGTAELLEKMSPVSFPAVKPAQNSSPYLPSPCGATGGQGNRGSDNIASSTGHSAQHGVGFSASAHHLPTVAEEPFSGWLARSFPDLSTVEPDPPFSFPTHAVPSSLQGARNFADSGNSTKSDVSWLHASRSNSASDLFQTLTNAQESSESMRGTRSTEALQRVKCSSSVDSSGPGAGSTGKDFDKDSRAASAAGIDPLAPSFVPIEFPAVSVQASSRTLSPPTLGERNGSLSPLSTHWKSPFVKGHSLDLTDTCSVSLHARDFRGSAKDGSARPSQTNRIGEGESEGCYYRSAATCEDNAADSLLNGKSGWLGSQNNGALNGSSMILSRSESPTRPGSWDSVHSFSSVITSSLSSLAGGLDGDTLLDDASFGLLLSSSLTHSHAHAMPLRSLETATEADDSAADVATSSTDRLWRAENAFACSADPELVGIFSSATKAVGASTAVTSSEIRGKSGSGFVPTNGEHGQPEGRRRSIHGGERSGDDDGCGGGAENIGSERNGLPVVDRQLDEQDRDMSEQELLKTVLNEAFCDGG